jgi:putative nucleotidyltransferase with HDIG domain
MDLRIDLRSWAAEQAQTQLASLPERLAHTRAVATAAERASAAVPPGDRDVLVATAYLHDIGYAPLISRTGFHPLDGARWLQEQGVPLRICCLVAHHTGARFEAEERDLADELAAFEVEDGPVLDALTFADLTTGPDGEEFTFDQRIDEILTRYPADDPVHRAICRARPFLAESVRRTLDRLGRQPI